jgi:pimeloyl-ACP methyl ester carboxylesterase
LGSALTDKSGLRAGVDPVEDAVVARFERRGWTLAFEERGRGPAVLLVHGVLMDRTMFAPQLDALAERYRVITPDLRGHGESEHRAEDYSQWDLMEDHMALLGHLGVEHAVWGGVSQGGFQSLRAALRHPDRVAGLILIDTQAGAEGEERAPLFEAAAAAAAEQGWTEDLVGMAAGFMFGEGASDELKRYWTLRWMAQTTTDAVQAMHAVTTREDITGRLGEIEQPAVVIHGEDDVAIDMELAKKLADGLPNLVEFATIPGAGHSSTVEQPDAVTSIIERFLDKGVRGAAPPGAKRADQGAAFPRRKRSAIGGSLTSENKVAPS